MNWMDRLKSHKWNSVSFVSTHKEHFLTFLPDNPDFLPLKTRIRPRNELTKLTKPKLPSRAALTWLSNNKEALHLFGWTNAELYRRNKAKKGIAWLLAWDSPLMDVALQHDGVIQFHFKDPNTVQTARPIKAVIQNKDKTTL